MSNTVDRMPNLPAPSRVGQGTAIEQSRAVAEVHAAIVVAQQCPRNLQVALAQMRESCSQKGLADRAFYRYPKGGQTVTGPSIHLARELARCWGNIQYGTAELRRDDDGHQSEMQAFAWDVQTNTRSAQIFIVPHKRDKKDRDGNSRPEALLDMRDIYENNTNNASRRVREAIFAVLPPWFTEEAKDLCSKTLADGGGVPLAQRIANAIGLYATFGITTDQLEQKINRTADKWTEHDVAQLGITYQSLHRGEITKDDEFPPRRVTADEIRGEKPAETAKAGGEKWPDLPPIPGGEP